MQGYLFINDILHTWCYHWIGKVLYVNMSKIEREKTFGQLAIEQEKVWANIILINWYEYNSFGQLFQGLHPIENLQVLSDLS